MNFPSHTGVLVVGAGPIGISVAISARRRGLDPLVIDSGAIANSIVGYPPGMTFFTTSERLEIGGHPFTSTGTRPTREEALSYYRGVVRAEALDVRPWVRLEGASRGEAGFQVRLATSSGTVSITCDVLVLATGYFDHPNYLDVPGENLPHVSHRFDEPHLCARQDVVVVGGKNSAIEAALLAFRAGGRVTLVHRGAELKPSVKYWLRPDFENRLAAGEIAVHFDSRVTGITSNAVQVSGPAGEITIPADRVYLLTGYHPDFELLESLGVKLDPVSGRPSLDPATLETNVPGLHLAGSVAAGRQISEVFIENGRYDGEKIFGGSDGARRADALYARSPRPTGE